MLMRQFLTCVIIFVERSSQMQTTLFFSKVDMKTNPSMMNITELTYKYKTIGSSKYIESIDPFTINYYRDLRTFVVSKNVVCN